MILLVYLSMLKPVLLTPGDGVTSFYKSSSPVPFSSDLAYGSTWFTPLSFHQGLRFYEQQAWDKAIGMFRDVLSKD
jgi:hypothetical protein